MTWFNACVRAGVCVKVCARMCACVSACDAAVVEALPAQSAAVSLSRLFSSCCGIKTEDEDGHGGTGAGCGRTVTLTMNLKRHLLSTLHTPVFSTPLQSATGYEQCDIYKLTALTTPRFISPLSCVCMYACEACLHLGVIEALIGRVLVVRSRGSVRSPCGSKESGIGRGTTRTAT